MNASTYAEMSHKVVLGIIPVLDVAMDHAGPELPLCCFCTDRSGSLL